MLCDETRTKLAGLDLDVSDVWSHWMAVTVSDVAYDQQSGRMSAQFAVGRSVRTVDGRFVEFGPDLFDGSLTFPVSDDAVQELAWRTVEQLRWWASDVTSLQVLCFPDITVIHDGHGRVAVLAAMRHCRNDDASSD